ncbi:hypothetical protein [Candidatus Methylobacter oryzae]|uniref:Uncharacterized protein n=1 Tax=Candidatus Methylobacter oryzae TaxID=2497749 RepID=A0ABY3C993_9GAMM|nr:hypothetical protein [Candidatus Methylobacter oryzae]TRW93321.1 hypothetical protein EKO24_012780 [Candidatus Methylobacter oryzae]
MKNQKKYTKTISNLSSITRSVEKRETSQQTVMTKALQFKTNNCSDASLSLATEATKTVLADARSANDNGSAHSSTDLLISLDANRQRDSSLLSGQALVSQHLDQGNRLDLGDDFANVTTDTPMYSFEEARTKADELDAEIIYYKNASDQLIRALFNFQAGKGLAALKYKNWRAYFNDRLTNNGCSTSSLYLFVEIAEFALTHRIAPTDEHLKSLRRICQIKKSIRQSIWDVSVQESQSLVPPVSSIEKSYQNYKQSHSCKNDSLLRKLIADKPDEQQVLAILYAVKERMESVENDPYGIQQLSFSDLKKMKSELDLYMTNPDRFWVTEIQANNLNEGYID